MHLLMGCRYVEILQDFNGTLELKWFLPSIYRFWSTDWIYKVVIWITEWIRTLIFNKSFMIFLLKIYMLVLWVDHRPIGIIALGHYWSPGRVKYNCQPFCLWNRLIKFIILKEDLASVYGSRQHKTYLRFHF